jgi:RNA polymerase subunit RPABC4/transcription elongation factor Spt4
MAKQGTKLCKYCKTEIPAGAKICPNCKKKQGGALKWIVIVVVVLVLISAAAGGGDKTSETQQASNSNSPTTNDNSAGAAQDTKEVEKESEGPIEYISVTATELSDALSNNAMKAQNDYENQYLEISGKLGNIDSNGKYISIDSDIDFDLTNIQCYIKSDEQKQVIMEMSRGNAIIVKGYCKDIGELLGYQIDIEEITAQ